MQNSLLFATELDKDALTTDYYLSYDLNNESIMYAKNIDEPIYPASVTKVMTALVLLDYYDFDDIITISLPDGYEYEGKVAYLTSGAQVTIEDILELLLIYSANDAAYAAAIAVSGDVDLFLDEMNNKAVAIGMTNTVFLNPDGLDQDGHKTTLRDLLLMSLEFVDNYKLISLTSKKSFSSDFTGNERDYYSTNQLIDNGYIGIKTGWTSKAGLTFIGLNLDNDRQILTIVNKSEVDDNKVSHFNDTEILYYMSLTNFGENENFSTNQPIYSIRNYEQNKLHFSDNPWIDFMYLDENLPINFLGYSNNALQFESSESDREVKLSENIYEVVWNFKLLEIFSIFAN